MKRSGDDLDVDNKKFNEKIPPKIRPFCMADFIMFGCIKFAFCFEVQKYKKTAIFESITKISFDLFCDK